MRQRTPTSLRILSLGLAAIATLVTFAAPSSARTSEVPAPPPTASPGLVDFTGRRAAPARFQEARQALDARGRVRVIATLQTRFDPQSLREASGRARNHDLVTSEQSRVRGALVGTDAVVTRTFDHVPQIALEVSPAALARLEQSGVVADVAVDEDSQATLDQTTPIIGADVMTSRGVDGTGWSVAVLDSGVEATHPFLNGRVVDGGCFRSDSGCPNNQTTDSGVGAAAPCTFTVNDGGAGCAHGTHVAGIAAGRTTSVPGTPGNGVARGATITAIQVFGRRTGTACGAGLAVNTVCMMSNASDQLAALEHVADLVTSGRRIAAVNMSIGTKSVQSTACDTSSRKPVIDMLWALGVPTVISSGNSSSSTGVSSPACISTAVTVGRTTDVDTVGSTSNSSAQVDLLAPGTSVFSSVLSGAFGTMTGTSMSAPHVAGGVAAFKERYPGARADQVIGAFLEHGVPVTDARNNITKPRLDLAAATSAWAFQHVSGVGNQPTSAGGIQGLGSAFGPAVVASSGPGAYTVRFPKIGAMVAGGNVQVTAKGSVPTRCKTSGWVGAASTAGGHDLTVGVRCFDLIGNPASSEFTVSYQLDEARHALAGAYLSADQPTNVSYVTDPRFSANSTMNSNSVKRVGVGTYDVTLPGMPVGGSTIVTAYGTTPEHCESDGANTRIVGTALVVRVRCSSASGVATDARFTLSYLKDRLGNELGASSSNHRLGAHVNVLAATPATTTWRSVPSTDAWNVPAGSAGSWYRRLSAGSYEVKLARQPASEAAPLVASLDPTDARTCRSDSWNQSGTDAIVRVLCVNKGGASTDSAFSLRYLTEASSL